MNRRRLLKSSVGGALALGVGTQVPRGLRAAASVLENRQDSILVVVQLSGGNDGLNTVIPYTDEAYYRARPQLAIQKSDALRVDAETGLHPELSGFSELLQDGLLSIVQGVGYENPNRSHFESMDIWHSCRRKSEPRADGWLGRFLELAEPVNATRSNQVAALHLGKNEQPLALRSQRVQIPSVQSVDQFRLTGHQGDALREWVSRLTAPSASPSSAAGLASSADDLLGFVQSSTSSALAASEQVDQALQDYQTGVDYPDSALGKQLLTIAQLIDSGIQARIYYVELDGFDTHAQQAATHANLLRQWSDAVTALVRDLERHGHGDRVCVLSFSEFGRRVAENASGGTDHGAAAPVVLAGGGVAAGVIGQPPNLEDLHDGDVKYQVDYRQVYATLVREWLGGDPVPVVGQDFETLPLFAAQA